MTEPSRATRALPAILAALAMVVALVFRHELVAWFTGAPDEAVAPPAGATADGVAYYTCAMHPQVQADREGSCPLCGMPLTPVTRAAQQAGVIRIDPARRAQLGVGTARVTKAPLTLAVRAAGRVAVDETRLHDVTSRVSGYATGLGARAIGQRVARGDTLFLLYSPELYAAQQEYLVARTSRDAAGDPGHGAALVRASETKLGLLGLGDDQLRTIVERGAPIERLPVRAPASGVVIEKAVVEGDAVTAGQRLFRIADLDQIWIEADVFEADLARITKGAAATITLTALPGRTFDGKVAFVYPYLDPASRAGRVRIALGNRGLELKPDMFATVAFELPLGDRLQLPSSAVVYTGARRIVFVDLGDGRFAPKEVVLGARSGEVSEVLSGVAEGDLVVTSGNFLVAAESRVRSGGALWEGRDAGP